MYYGMVTWASMRFVAGGGGDGGEGSISYGEHASITIIQE
jgi:hypothetical protein